MLWYIILLLPSWCVCRPIPDLRALLEGIDPSNNDHQCGYESGGTTLQPWQINQGICPPSLTHLCRREVTNPDPEGDPIYIYVSPFFDGDIVMSTDEHSTMIADIDEESIDFSSTAGSEIVQQIVQHEIEANNTRLIQYRTEIQSQKSDSAMMSLAANEGTQQQLWDDMQNNGDQNVQRNRSTQTMQYQQTFTNREIRRTTHANYETIQAHGDMEQNTDVKSRKTRAIHKFKNMWWKGGKIPYTIDSRFDDDKTNMIKRALQHWETMTCIRFKTQEADDTDYVRFVYQPGCWSYVGRQGGEQLISMGPGCSVFGTIVHEVGHAVGLWHEQSRQDRDKYIKILYENMASGTEDNFKKLPKQNVTSLGYAYDYESIMHYAPNAFSVTGKPTMKIKKIGRRYGFQIGLHRGLSPLDIAQVRGMYKCNKKDVEKHKDKCFKSIKGDGREYRGDLDYTIDNVTCQHWTSQWPHKHKTYDPGNEASNEKKGIGNHNFCRNPSGHKETPWCFTTLKKIRWQFCNIKIC